MLTIMSSIETDRQRYYKSKEMRIRGFRFPSGNLCSLRHVKVFYIN